VTDESPLERLFPRIAKQVVAHWGHKEFEKYASELIIDNRGDRRGLPKEVLSDVLFLYALHLDMFGYDPQDSFLPFANNKTTS
jgi:hypothetical protein